MVEKRKKAGMTQAEVAKKLRRYQSFVATVEGGQRKIDVVELLAFAEAIGFDPREAIKRSLRSNPIDAHRSIFRRKHERYHPLRDSGIRRIG